MCSVFLGSLCLITPVSAFSQELPATEEVIPMPELGPLDTIPVPVIILEHEYVPVSNLEWVWVSAPYPRHLLKRSRKLDSCSDNFLICTG